MRISDWSSDVCSSDLDSNTRIGSPPLRSTSAGILLFGLAPTKPLENWSPSQMLISQASYSAPAWPAEIGRESSRERVCQYVYVSVVAVHLNTTSVTPLYTLIHSRHLSLHHNLF